MKDQMVPGPVDILLVEDNPGDVRLTREAFEKCEIECTFYVVTDGVAAVDFVFQRGEYEDVPRPDLILLDLNLPRKDGHDVLEELHGDPSYRSIPIIVLSGSEATQDVQRSYDLCVNGYLTKPIDGDEFIEMLESFQEFWFSFVKVPVK